MGCSGRVKVEDIRPEQNWEFISLNDFHSTSCFKPFAYVYLWASLCTSTAVYSVDTFTAINLLAFDRWSSEIKPFIPLKISKWIFSACIIASLINLAFEFTRAIRVMRRGTVAESYLDSLAVRLQGARPGKGKGWKRFLVFAELTKSKKGAEYVALFTYFAFQTWIRIIFCQGPRQVINGLTLYSVFKVQFDPSEKNVEMSILKFFKNIGILADKEKQQALILSGMVFTLVIWIFGALSLILAVLLYLLFLWHYIPDADGGLSGYCERKINTRLAQIVSVKVKKAIEEEERKRHKADARALAKGQATHTREARLPDIYDAVLEKDHKFYTPRRMNSTSASSLYSVQSDIPLHIQKSPINGFIQNLERSVSPATTISSSNSYGATTPFLRKHSDLGNNKFESHAVSFMAPDMAKFSPPTCSDISNSNRTPIGYNVQRIPSQTRPQRVLPTAQFSQTAYQAESSLNSNYYSQWKPPNATFTSTNYMPGNQFLQDDVSQTSRSDFIQEQNYPIGNISARIPKAESIRRLASPAPYLNGQIQSPAFRTPSNKRQQNWR